MTLNWIKSGTRRWECYVGKSRRPDFAAEKDEDTGQYRFWVEGPVSTVHWAPDFKEVHRQCEKMVSRRALSEEWITLGEVLGSLFPQYHIDHEDKREQDK